MSRMKWKHGIGVLVLLVMLWGQAHATVMEYRYNLGPAAGVTGFTDIDRTVYNATAGYGWIYRLVNGALDEYNALFRTRGANPDKLLDTLILENRSPGVGQPATDSRAYTLRFDVPDGLYTVSITSGDHYVKSDDTFAVGDVVFPSTYGDYLKLDDPDTMVFHSGLVQAGNHVTVTSPEFQVTNGYLYVGWGRKLGTIEWGTINSLVITQVPEPATLGLLGWGGITALLRRKKS